MTSSLQECEVQAAQMRRQQMEHDRQNRQPRGEEVIRKSETRKTTLYPTPGNQFAIQRPFDQNNCNAVDDNYMVIGGHVDALMLHKIINHEYIDFARLLPKGANKVSAWEDNRMELVSQGGMTYFVPVSDRESVGITNFSRWEQAFRVFSNIYTRAYPSRSSELIQYNHIIFTASNSYTWENVYTYDKEFRLHLSKFPQRSWSIILQQAWSMYLKDKIFKDETNNFSSGSNNSAQKYKSKENCRRYNKGKCNKGASCKYQHRCDECGKFGHGAHICRRRSGQNKTQSGVVSQESQSVGNSKMHH